MELVEERATPAPPRLEPIVQPMRHEGHVRGAIYNPEEDRILTWSLDNTARLWDTATGAQVGPPLRHEGYVEGAVYNRDGSRILTWSSDNTARLWDAATGEQLGPTLLHEGSVKGATYNQDESRILTWSGDKTARLWNISWIPRGNLIEIACEMLTVPDTAELKKRYEIDLVEPLCGPHIPAPNWEVILE